MKRLVIILALISLLVIPTANAQSGGYRIKMDLIEEGSYTGITNGWVYSWFDADQDGIVDLEDEVETLVSSTQTYSSISSYPVGDRVMFWSDADGYYPRMSQASIPHLDSDSDTIAVQSIRLRKMTSTLDTYIFCPYIFNGSQSFLDFRFYIPEEDTGFGYEEIMDFNSLRMFTHPILSVAVKATEAYNVMFENYDKVFMTPVWNYYYWILEPWFNDIDDPADGYFVIHLPMEVIGPFSLYVSILDTMAFDFYENEIPPNIPSQPTFMFNGTMDCYNTTDPRLIVQPEFSRANFDSYADYGWYEGGDVVYNNPIDDFIYDPVGEMLSGNLFAIMFMVTFPVFMFQMIKMFNKPKRSTSMRRTTSTPATPKPKPKPKPRFVIDTDVYIFEGDESGDDYE